MPPKKSVSETPARRTRKTATEPLKLVPPPARPPIASSEAIARRAYEIYVERGQPHGHDLEHWLAAERELLDRA